VLHSLDLAAIGVPLTHNKHLAKTAHAFLELQAKRDIVCECIYSTYNLGIMMIVDDCLLVGVLSGCFA
jgi:hypothetical protein